MHLGMWVLLEIGTFSAVMLASYSAFLPEGAAERFARRFVLARRTRDRASAKLSFRDAEQQ
jgi:hypothetical protein